MSKLYLQNIVNDIFFENLPVKWQGFDFSWFSKDKTLFKFQQDGLQNALKGLWLYFKDKKADKQSFFNLYQDNNFLENFDYDLKKKEGKKTAKYLLEYDKDYPAINSKIPFAYFINRMSFWMATGSGKTLIIVKLIEILGKLIAEKELPEGDILFLAHRDDLLEQFKNHVDEFNSFNFNTKIVLKELKDYESVKRDNILPFNKNEITVFYYRSDLISDESKEKLVNFKDYDNNGKWYILLDEAHKGDKEDSKRQILYSILSRNGFLFNFSATFTDPRDFVTCVFSFNLSKFVKEGYGKHIYLSTSNISGFKEENDFSPIEKQKIVLKTLFLLTYINKYFERISSVNNSLYHKPLLLTLVNSTNIEDSDLEMFFNELEKIAKNEIRKDLLEAAKKEIIDEFKNNVKFEFEDDLNCSIDTELFSKLEYNDILNYVLNSKTYGNIEVIKIPQNKQELIFKLKTSEKPFALIKIGDISDWLKNKLNGYEINESIENESFFRTINNDDSDINILMGSRSFYEGWDSNRPNVLLFINIGVKDAKKFVLQSVGRGVRIEPLKNKRKRLQNLITSKEIELEKFQDIKALILPIETLFILGTNANNLKEIIETLKAEKEDKGLGELFVVNPERKGKNLLIPIYKNSETILADEKEPQKYFISKKDFDLTSEFYNFLGDKIALVKYNCEVNVLSKTKESFSKKEKYYNLNKDNSLLEPELTLSRIFSYFNIKDKEFEKFKELENEIIHFKKIRFNGNDDKYEDIKAKINEIKQSPEIREKLDEQYGKISKEEYNQLLKTFEESDKYEMNNQKINIKYLTNHYYIPVILSNDEKVNYINHIINIQSEVNFIERLEEYIKSQNNIFKDFDWWMFSKIDQTIDDIYIPYYNPNENKINDYHPDFIFWLQKGSKYIILFVDPKGVVFAGYEHKIDSYKKIFENKIYKYNNYEISIKLLFYTNDISRIADEYRKYWFDNFNELKDKINI